MKCKTKPHTRFIWPNDKHALAPFGGQFLNRQMRCHSARHLTVQNDSFKNEAVSGAIGWCMFDYNTHKDFGSGDRICYHGVMDIFRIPKYAASVYGVNIDTPYLEVLSGLNIGEQEASEIKEVYVMTNADFVRFKINEDV